MNKEAQEMLDMILSKSVQDLTEGDIAFLKARQSYLSDEQKKKFSSVLSGEDDAANTDQYSDLSKKDLLKLAEERGLDVKDKNKNELADLLRADDAANSEDK